MKPIELNDSSQALLSTANSTRAPVAVFAYRRRDHLERALASLQRCDGFSDSPVTIFVDGAKGETDRAEVLAVVAFVEGLNWPNLRISISPRNKGLRQSIYDGVAHLTEQYGRVIVVEDDLALAPVALDYFNAALDRYAAEERVMAVCGYMYDVKPTPTGHDCAFLPVPNSWGWGTWNRAWNGFSIDNTRYRALLRSPSFRKQMRVADIVDYVQMLELQLAGKVDSWAALWIAHVLAEGGLCVYPPRTFIKNLGISSAGATHSSRLNPVSKSLKALEDGLAFGEAFSLPEKQMVDFALLDRIRTSRHARLLATAHRLGYLRRRYFF